MANFHHNKRNHGYRGRRRNNNQAQHSENKEEQVNDQSVVKDNQDSRNNRKKHDQQEARELYRERREKENRERENRENKELRENRERRERRDNNRDNQAITTFMLGEKELEGKNAQFQYDKGWYSITDIVGEEKNVIYKSKNAQEAYTKWNVYIGRKKERPQRAEKMDN